MSFPVKCQCFLTSQENIFYISLSTLDHTCTRCLLFFIFNVTLICPYTVGCPTMYTLSFSIELPYSGGKTKINIIALLWSPGQSSQVVPAAQLGGHHFVV